MDLWVYVWYQLWFGVADIFQWTLSVQWAYERIPEGQWVPIRPFLQIQSGWSLAGTYPTDLQGTANGDAANYVRTMALFDAIAPVIAPYLSQGVQVWYDYYAMRPPGIDWGLSLRVDVYYFPDGEGRSEITQVISLPLTVKPGTVVGQRAMFPYAAWQLDGGAGVDSELREAILEVRDGLRPWTLGGTLTPVPNEGNPGFLELHRQLTGEESLGVYYEPTLRQMVADLAPGCLRELIGRRVWVRVTVTGERPGAGDTRLPYGTGNWTHNHYGQVRLAWRYPNHAETRYTEWRWIRARDYVELFTLPWVDGLVPTVTPEYRRYAGLTVNVTVISGARVQCDPE